MFCLQWNSESLLNEENSKVSRYQEIQRVTEGYTILNTVSQQLWRVFFCKEFLYLIYQTLPSHKNVITRKHHKEELFLLEDLFTLLFGTTAPPVIAETTWRTTRCQICNYKPRLLDKQFPSQLHSCFCKW